MNTDLRHFARVVSEYRDDDEAMNKLAGVLSIVAIVMLSVTVANLKAAPQAFSSPSRVSTPAHEPAEAATFSINDLAAIVTACMRGEQFITYDPHTDADYAVYCNVELLGRVP
jgi:hypothetical protein